MRRQARAARWAKEDRARFRLVIALRSRARNVTRGRPLLEVLLPFLDAVAEVRAAENRMRAIAGIPPWPVWA